MFVELVDFDNLSLHRSDFSVCYQKKFFKNKLYEHLIFLMKHAKHKDICIYFYTLQSIL